MPSPLTGVPGSRPPWARHPRDRHSPTLRAVDRFKELLYSQPLALLFECQETSGASLTDSVTQLAANTQGTGTLWQQQGVLERSLQWDGVAQYAQLTTGQFGTTVNGADAVTVLALHKLSAIPGASGATIVGGVIGSGAAGLSLSVNQALTCAIAGRSISTDAGISIVTSAMTLAVGRWYLQAGVLDYLNKRVDLYLNGTLVANAAAPNFSSPVYVTGSPVATHDNIGNFIDGTRFYPGNLSHIAFIKGRTGAAFHKDLARMIGVTL